MHTQLFSIYILTVILSWKFICDFSLHCKRVCSKRSPLWIHIYKVWIRVKSSIHAAIYCTNFVAIGPQFFIEGPSDDIFWQFRSKIQNFFRIRLSKVCERSGFFLSHFNDLSFSFGGWNKWLVVNLYLQLL